MAQEHLTGTPEHRNFTGLHQWESYQFGWGSVNLSPGFTEDARALPLVSPSGAHEVTSSRPLARYLSTHLWLMSAVEYTEVDEPDVQKNISSKANYKAQTSGREELLVGISMLDLPPRVPTEKHLKKDDPKPLEKAEILQCYNAAKQKKCCLALAQRNNA